MNIPRPQLVADLLGSSARNNGLLVGDPGIGKSWALREVKVLAESRGTITELIAIDTIYAEDESELDAYVGWKHGLIDYLRRRSATSPGKGLLLFDAFDAARSDKKRNLFLRLIRRCRTELRDNWNILVSVRTFDAEKSRELTAMFQLADALSARSRQTSIPVLSDDEINSALNADSSLATLFRKCPLELREILRIPFNLWLLEQIAKSASGVEVSDLYTATELLNLFWECRVHREGSREQNEAILECVVRDQIRSKQLGSLRADVYVPALAKAWDRMFSANVLEEDKQTKNGVKFTHNILFDFAVARLLIPDDPIRLAEFMAADPARPLFLRPSLVYHFEDQFRRRPQRFWNTFFSACASKHPAMTPITRLILPTVLVTEGRNVEDFQPLINALTRSESYAATAVTYVLQAVRAVDFARPRCSESTHCGRRCYATLLRILTRSSLGTLDGLMNRHFAMPNLRHKDAIMNDCAWIAQALFDWAWIKEGQPFENWNYRYLSSWAIPQICRSFSGDSRHRARASAKCWGF